MKTVIRARALDKVRSPEDLNQAVRVTLPRQWAALLALLALLAGAIVWAAVSSVPTTLSAPGFLLPRGGLRTISAPAAGTVRGLDLRVGTHVVAGQAVGHMASATKGAGARNSPVDVVAPATGVVTSVGSQDGAYASAGQSLAVVQPVGGPSVIYAFIPVDQAAELGPGVPARVTFGSGLGTAYGYATGSVDSVGQYPVSASHLRLILPSASLVQRVQRLGVSNQVVVAMTLSAHTPSGLAWPSGNGPPKEVPPGLSSTVQFVLGTHHPIDNVL